MQWHSLLCSSISIYLFVYKNLYIYTCFCIYTLNQKAGVWHLMKLLNQASFLLFYLEGRGNGIFSEAWNHFLADYVVHVFVLVDDSWWKIFCLKVKHRTWVVKSTCSFFFLWLRFARFLSVVFAVQEVYLEITQTSPTPASVHTVHTLRRKTSCHWWCAQNGCFQISDAAVCCRPCLL